MQSRFLLRFSLSAFALLSIPLAVAQEERAYRAGSLVIEAPWSRATPGGAKIGSGYMRIVNSGPEPDRLIGGTASVAARIEVHESSMSDGIARMRPVDGGLLIKPGETVDLKPGGLHAMLVDLKQPLKEGDTIKGTLVFEKAGTVAIEYRVGGIGAQSAGMSHHHH
jgi:periplasmic copper chaperone A